MTNRRPLERQRRYDQDFRWAKTRRAIVKGRSARRNHGRRYNPVASNEAQGMHSRVWRKLRSSTWKRLSFLSTMRTKKLSPQSTKVLQMPRQVARPRVKRFASSSPSGFPTQDAKSGRSGPWLPNGCSVTKVQLLCIVLSLSCANYLLIPYWVHLPQNLGDRVERGYEGLLSQPS